MSPVLSAEDQSREQTSEHIEHFEVVVDIMLRKLGHEDGRTLTLTRLINAIEQFKRDQIDADRSLRVAAMLRELTAFKQLVADADPGAKLALHPDTVAALTGRHPAPAAFERLVVTAADFTMAGSKPAEFSVWGSERNGIQSVENLFVHAASRDEPTFVARRPAQRITDEVWTELGIDPSSTVAVLFVMNDWLKAEPTEIREGLIDLIDIRLSEVRKAFQIVDGFNTGRRTIRSFAGPSAEWQLMRAVLDEIWPTERGKPKSSEIVLINKIIDESLWLALGYPESDMDDTAGDLDPDIAGTPLLSKPNSRPRRNSPSPIGADRKSAIITFRHQLATLTAVVGLLETQLTALENEHDGTADHQDIIRSTHRSISQLAIWRRELNRRLDQGDYLIHHTQAPRPTGDLLWLPPFPDRQADSANAAFVAALCEVSLQVGRAPALDAPAGRRPRRR